MIHERKGGHFRRQYSAQAKKAGEAMMKVMRDFAEPLSVQDARVSVQRRRAGSGGGSGCGCKR